MRRTIRSLLFAAVVMLLVAAACCWLVLSPLTLARERLEFTVAAGSSLRAAAHEVVDAGVDLPPWLLVAAGKLLRVEGSIKAGSYEVARGITLLDLLQKMARGDVTQAEVVLIEGWTFRQIRERLDAHPDLLHDSAGLSEQEILRRIGAAEAFAEGILFPDTYLFTKRSSDFAILARAHRAMQRHLAREWSARADALPYQNAYQALIMASIIEKETGVAEDRPLIAGVFLNRLRIGMLLQTDPTVIYGLGERFDGNLRKRDLLADTPYNTYLRPGLPPTPIASAGLASIRAALHPSPTEALYFVARGDGSSQFSRTLEAHQQAVIRYQRGGKP